MSRQDLVLPFRCIVTQRISDRRGNMIYIMFHCQKSSKRQPNLFDVNISTTHHHNNTANKT